MPMVFEVINDRGVKLQPYKILKGKLLGQLEKSVLEQRGLNAIWEDNITAINAYGEDEADDFFRYFLKAKFADTRKDGQSLTAITIVKYLRMSSKTSSKWFKTQQALFSF